MCMKKRYFARLSITVIVMVAMVFPVFSFAETGDIPQDEKVTSTIPYVYEEPDDITILDESKLIPEDSTSSNVTTPSRVPATAIWKCESKKRTGRAFGKFVYHGDSCGLGGTLSQEITHSFTSKISGNLKVSKSALQSFLSFNVTSSYKIKKKFSDKAPKEKGRYELQYRKKYDVWTVKQRLYKVVPGTGKLIKTDTSKTVYVHRGVGYDYNIAKIN